MRIRTRTSGLTLVELLVVLAVMGLLLGLMTAYFAAQTHATAESQAQNNARVKVRSIGELLSQDFETAGALAVYDSSGGQVIKATATDTYGMPSTCSDNRSGCVTYDSTNHVLEMWYFSSLAGASGTGPCHDVRYHYDASTQTLYRTDDDCAASHSSFSKLAGGITAFSVKYECAQVPSSATSTLVDTPSSCYGTADNFIRSVVIHVEGQQTGRGGVTTATFDTNAPTPNLRKPPEYWINPTTSTTGG